MGSCQSRSSAVVVEVPKSLDARSVRSGSQSGSQASESTVTISNTQQTQTHNKLARESIEEDVMDGSIDYYEIEEDDVEEPIQVEETSSARPNPYRSIQHENEPDTPERGFTISTSSKNKISPKKAAQKVPPSSPPSSSSGQETTLPSTTGADVVSASSDDNSHPSNNSNACSSNASAPHDEQHEQQSQNARRLLFPLSLPPKKPHDHHECRCDEMSANRTTIHSSTLTVDRHEVMPSSSIEQSIKRSPINRKKRLATIRTTIPEEEDPEMPSDEEDFCQDMVRNTPRDEPGRLVPIKLKTKHKISVASVAIARSAVRRTAVENLKDDNSAVHMDTLSEFQRLKLQVKLQTHQEMKDRRIHKVEDRLQDAESYRKLWLEFLTAEEELAKRDQEAGKPTRSNSLNLKDARSWFFDFSSPDAAFEEAQENPDENGSNASLSLLSEQSLDAQKRFYAEKRRRLKQKKKQGKLVKRQKRRELRNGITKTSTLQPLIQRLEAATLPDGRSCHTMTGGSTASGVTRDYGPVRDKPPTPLDVEVSFHARGPHPPTDDAGSYISDLGDESLNGGMAGAASSLGGNSFSQQQQYYASNSLGSNDYGVKRRIRPHSGYTQDHEAMKAKLLALEQSLARMRYTSTETGISTTINSRPTNTTTEITEGGAETAVGTVQSEEKGGDEGGILPYGLFLDGLTSSTPELAPLSPPRDQRNASHSNIGCSDGKTEKKLVEQIHEAILAANTPPRKTRKSYSPAKNHSKQHSRLPTSYNNDETTGETRRNLIYEMEESKAGKQNSSSTEEIYQSVESSASLLPEPSNAVEYESSPMPPPAPNCSESLEAMFLPKSDQLSSLCISDSVPEASTLLNTATMGTSATARAGETNVSGFVVEAPSRMDPSLNYDCEINQRRKGGIEGFPSVNPTKDDGDILNLHMIRLTHSSGSEHGLLRNAPPRVSRLICASVSNGPSKRSFSTEPGRTTKMTEAKEMNAVPHDEFDSDDWMDSAGGDDSSVDTGPYTPNQFLHSSIEKERLSDQKEDKEATKFSLDGNYDLPVLTEEKKNISHFTEPVTDVDESSRASSLHEPEIACMSKDEFFRISYGKQPGVDIVAFPHELDDEETRNTRSDEETRHGNPLVFCSPFETSISRDGNQGKQSSTTSWTTPEIDTVLFEKNFPERTSLMHETPPPPAGVLVTPDSTPSSDYDLSSPDMMDDNIDSETTQKEGRVSRRLQDPDGRRIGMSLDMEFARC